MHVVFATTVNVNLFNYCVTPFAPVQTRKLLPPTPNHTVTATFASVPFSGCRSSALLSQISTQIETHTHPFNGLFSGTTQVSRYQKGKTNLDFTEARDSEWQWHQQGPMQVCTSLQTVNHASTSPLEFFTGRMPFLPPNQQRQSTEGTALKAHPHR